MTPQRKEEIHLELARFWAEHDNLAEKPAYTTYAVKFARLLDEALSSIEALKNEAQNGNEVKKMNQKELFEFAKKEVIRYNANVTPRIRFDGIWARGVYLNQDGYQIAIIRCKTNAETAKQLKRFIDKKISEEKKMTE